MARFIALDWDAREIRVAIARTRGLSCQIEEAFAVPMLKADQAATAEPNIGTRLAEALAPHVKGRNEPALISIGRSNIELRSLTVPQVPDEELPDIVRFQAMKQFSALGDSWPLDFVRLDRAADGGQIVLAAALSTELVEQIRRTCQAGSVEAKRLVLRPFAAASLWRRRSRDERCSVMIDVLGEEADLTVLADGHVVLLRTVRVPAESGEEELSKFLLGELRRTMAAAHNQLGSRRIELAIVCGASNDHASLRSQIEQALSLETIVFDPFDGLDLAPALSAELAREQPHRTGRFAPLLGMLLDEANSAEHAIDFLNPRRRPEPKSNRRRNLLIAAVAATLLLALFGWVQWEHSYLDAEIEELQGKVSALDRDLKQYEKPRRITEEVDEFVAGDVTWLDELREISDRFPPASDAIVSQMTIHSQPTGGLMIMEGNIRDRQHIETIEKNLRREGRHVSGTGLQKDDRQQVYQWKFKESIQIDAEEESVGVKQAPAKPAATPATTKVSMQTGASR